MVNEKDVGVKFRIYRDAEKVPDEKPATAESVVEIRFIILESASFSCVLGKSIIFGVNIARSLLQLDMN